MSLSFLPENIRRAAEHLNGNLLSEIRLRAGLPVIVCYKGEYHYLDGLGLTDNRDRAVICGGIDQIIGAATGGSVYAYAEQIKGGFITCCHGVRIGLAGEYVTQNGTINTIKNITSLNIRIAHDVEGCAGDICNSVFGGGVCSVLLFSKPGLGKTTKLRDIARYLSENTFSNVLVFDERGEISGMDGLGNGFWLGDRVDVVRSGNKLEAFKSAIRAMKPDVIITDELYGEDDLNAVTYAAQCGIAVVASSHITDKNLLAGMPFKYFVELKTLLGQPVIYDKNFNTCSGGGAYDCRGGVSVCK